MRRLRSTSERAVRHRRGRRDRLYARLGILDPLARHLGDQERDGRCRPRARRYRRHAELLRQRLDLFALRRRRSGHPAQLLHGCAWRRVFDGGADRHRHRRDRSGNVQDRGDLPVDERLQPGAHRRHRRTLGRADQRRPDPPSRLWLAERRADVRADLPAPHVRLRHDARAGGGGQGRPLQARLQQPEGVLQEAVHR